MFAKSVAQLFENSNLDLRGAFSAVLLGLVTVGAVPLLQNGEALALVAEPRVSQPGSEPAIEAPATPVATPVVAQPAPPPENARYRMLSEFLAKRYNVSQAITLDLVTIAHSAGQQLGLDPLLIIAVMAVESRFNPIAESVAGAKGLMQVIPKYHIEKFREHGGVKAVFDPETNILVGAQILKEYLKRTGSLNTALQLYGGVSSDADDAYFGKVMSEKQRLQQYLRKSPVRHDAEASLAGERFAFARTR